MVRVVVLVVWLILHNSLTLAKYRYTQMRTDPDTGLLGNVFGSLQVCNQGGAHRGMDLAFLIDYIPYCIPCDKTQHVLPQIQTPPSARTRVLYILHHLR